MKQTKLFLIAAILSLTFLWSCKDSSELANAIPADAITVIHIDTKSLLKKADYSPLDNKIIKEALEKQKKTENEEAKKAIAQLEDFLKNPNSVGIDLTGDCYIYVNKETTGLIWKMNDADKFKKLLTKTFQLPKQMIEEENGVSTLSLMGMANVGWTKDKFIVMTSSSSSYIYGGERPDFASLMKKQLTQKADESINANKMFADFSKKQGDISIFSSYDNIAGLWSSMLGGISGLGNSYEATALNGIKDLLKGVGAAGYISFEKGEVTAENSLLYDSPESEKRYADLAAKLSSELKGEYLKYFNEKPILSFAAGIKGEGVYGSLADMGIIKMIDEYAGSELQEKGIDIKSLISNVNGDVSISLNGLKKVKKSNDYGFGEYEYESTEPEISFFADLKDATSTLNFLKERISEAAPDSSLVVINPATIAMDVDGNKFYLGTANNMLYCTNSESVYNNISTSANIKNDYAAGAVGKTSFFLASLSSLKNIASDEFGNGDAEVTQFISKGIDLLGDFTYTTDMKLVGQGKLVVNDNSANSLAVITKYIDSVVTYAIQKYN